MGLFSKKEPCPICGGAAKGLFLAKIADKKILCSSCTEQISMSKELLKTATPDFVRTHMEYRRKNAERYAAARWDAELEALGMKVGVDLEQKILYLSHIDLDNKENPSVFAFDQITGYELYRLKKLVDSADDPGETALESTLSALSGLVKLAGKGSNSTDTMTLRLTTTDPYWPEIELKFINPDTDLYGVGGSYKEMERICQVFKRAARREPVRI